MPVLRHAIRGQIRRLMGDGASMIDLDHGDAGLYGPASIAWRVHGDFTTMMVGGIASLMLQMLHPLALAGVWDHSNFEADMLGRLRRTAQFIAATTYGSTREAERLIDRIRAIHDRVQGHLPDGTPYSANDPLLLTWVHVAEAVCFLAAYRRYLAPGMTLAEQDRYFAETAILAERLGAAAIPRSLGEVQVYLDAIRPELRFDGRTAAVAQALLSQPAPSRALAPMGRVMQRAALDLLPGWALRMHGREVEPFERPAIRLGTQGIGAVLRWALDDSSASRARRRVAPAA